MYDGMSNSDILGGFILNPGYATGASGGGAGGLDIGGLLSAGIGLYGASRGSSGGQYNVPGSVRSLYETTLSDIQKRLAASADFFSPENVARNSTAMANDLYKQFGNNQASAIYNEQGKSGAYNSTTAQQLYDNGLAETLAKIQASIFNQQLAGRQAQQGDATSLASLFGATGNVYGRAAQDASSDKKRSAAGSALGAAVGNAFFPGIGGAVGGALGGLL